MMRTGVLRGNMNQCLAELQESDLPPDFKLAQVRSLLRYLREVSNLVNHVKTESGFGCDTTAYLEILCAKEDSNLYRRVSDTRILKQDFDEKRREWRKKKKNLINAMSEMGARALKFECNERKTIALYAIQYYKNVMAKDDGAIPGESESTDGLIEQYRRHRDEISKIPMYTDSILRMLKDIRKTVHASAKLQPGTNAFTQFLDEWWASVVNFLQHSSIVEAEKNAREVMQTLKKLKGKQEENKKREINRLLSKLDAQDKATPPITPASEPFEMMDDSLNPEDTVRWDDLNRSPKHGLTNQRRRGRDEGRAQQDCCNGPTDESDEKKERARKGGSSWSEDNDSGRPIEGETHNGNLDCGGLTQSLADMPAFPLNVGTMSIASWDGVSEPTMGTDAGTDQDVVATSGIPEGNSEDEDEDDDMFEVADSLDLGAVALRAVGTGADGFAMYEDTVRTPQAIRHMTDKLGVEQKRYSAALDYFRHEQQLRTKRTPMPPAPMSSSSRTRNGAGRGRLTPASWKGKGRRISSSGAESEVESATTNVTTSNLTRAHSLYIASSSSMHSSTSSKKRTVHGPSSSRVKVVSSFKDKRA